MSERKSGFKLGSALAALVFAVVLGPVLGSGALGAAEVAESYDFAIDEWHDIDATDGPVTLHRIRLDRKEDRLTKSTIARPHNQEHLQPVRFQLEYTNGASQKWRARIMVRWLDEDGEIIDGFSANETLEKKSARKVAQASVSTLKYGIARAKTFEFEVRFEPN